MHDIAFQEQLKTRKVPIIDFQFLDKRYRNIAYLYICFETKKNFIIFIEEKIAFL